MMQKQRQCLRVLEFVCRDKHHVADFVTQLIELQEMTRHDVKLTIDGTTVTVGDSDIIDTHEEFCIECKELFVESSMWRRT